MIDNLPDQIDRKQKTIPLSKLIALRRANLSINKIAEVVNCTKQNVYERLKDVEEFESFANNLDIEFEALQHRIYNSIDLATILKAPLQSRVWAIAVLEDKKRLIRNQSTAIIDVDHTISSISDLSRREKILEAKYKVLCDKKLE